MLKGKKQKSVMGIKDKGIKVVNGINIKDIIEFKGKIDMGYRGICDGLRRQMNVYKGKYKVDNLVMVEGVLMWLACMLERYTLEYMKKVDSIEEWFKALDNQIKEYTPISVSGDRIDE